MENVYERLTEVLRDCFDDDRIVAKPEMTADNVEGWDSLAQVRLILTVEKAFKIQFTADEISSLSNVGDLAKAIDAE